MNQAAIIRHITDAVRHVFALPLVILTLGFGTAPEAMAKDTAPNSVATRSLPDYRGLDDQEAFKAYFLNPSHDDDKDGFSDLQEYLTGSAVKDSSSTPKEYNLAMSVAEDPENPAGAMQPPGDDFLSHLRPTLETQFSLPLARQAAALGYDPVRIFNWVHENVEFEEYVQSRKGALATYDTKRGNEWINPLY